MAKDQNVSARCKWRVKAQSAPAQTGWHRVAIAVADGRAEIWWDGQKLPGGPFVVDRVLAGQVGVYATFTGGRGRAETMVDGFAVWRPTG